MMSLILAEAELERVPTNLWSHPSVRVTAKQRKKKPSQLILDASFHHSAMKNIAEGRRRGRPDIVHVFLLSALESIANKEGFINSIIVHTRNDDAIFINPETRIMRNFTRFIGLMEQLFEKESIWAGKKKLLDLTQNKTLDDIVRGIHPGRTIVFSESGSPTHLQSYFKSLKQDSVDHSICIIGGFPSGSFRSDVASISDDMVSIYPEKLTAWTTVNEAVVHYYDVFKD